jgi:uncharacterized protein (DUF58 family)
MYLKETLYATVGSSAVLLAIGYATGGIIFYFASAALMAFIIMDYARIKVLQVIFSGRLHVVGGLSREECAPGEHVKLEAILTLSKGRPRALNIAIPVESSIELSGSPGQLMLSAGSPVRLDTVLMPHKCGDVDVGPISALPETYFFKASVAIGRKYRLMVRMPLGRSLSRPNLAHQYGRAYNGFEVMTTDRKSGSEFSGIRPYVAGDNIKNIDTALSIKYNHPIVREYEDEHPMAAFLLLDVDQSMGEGGESDPLKKAIRIAMGLADQILIDGERVGIICFSRRGIEYFLPPGMGRTHIVRLKNVLSNIQPVISGNFVRPQLLSLGDIYSKGVELDLAVGRRVIEPILEATVSTYKANIGADGFAIAIRKAISASNGRFNFIILTNISMGVPSLLNGARLATYYGHRVSVQVTPGISQYAELESTASRLKGHSMNVAFVGPRPSVRPMTTAIRG